MFGDVTGGLQPKTCSACSNDHAYASLAPVCSRTFDSPPPPPSAAGGALPADFDRCGYVHIDTHDQSLASVSIYHTLVGSEEPAIVTTEHCVS